jgi:hypothetical protein
MVMLVNERLQGHVAQLRRGGAPVPVTERDSDDLRRRPGAGGLPRDARRSYVRRLLTGDWTLLGGRAARRPRTGDSTLLNGARRLRSAPVPDQ